MRRKVSNSSTYLMTINDPQGDITEGKSMLKDLYNPSSRWRAIVLTSASRDTHRIYLVPSSQLLLFRCGCSLLQDSSSFPPLQPTSERCRLNATDRCWILGQLLLKTAAKSILSDQPPRFRDCCGSRGCDQTETVSVPRVVVTPMEFSIDSRLSSISL